MTFLFEAIPANGSLIHAVPSDSAEGPRGMYPGHASAYVRLLSSARSLCGIRGRDSMSYGGMRLYSPRDGDETLTEFTATEPNPDATVAWDGKALNKYCPRCVAKAKKIRAADAAD